MNATESQRTQILDWMLKGHRITGLEALHRFRCMRLGARIHELIRRGIPVSSRFVCVTDSEGKKKRVKEYWIEPEYFAWLDFQEALGREPA